MNILVVNCGSSSIKYQFYELPSQRVLAKGIVERIGDPAAALEHQVGDDRQRHELTISDHEVGMRLILEHLAQAHAGATGRVDAVGHRVVHGGEAFRGSVLIDDQVLEAVERCAELAPLHNPANLTGIRAARRRLPDVPHVACFDTAFHATLPQVAYMYALPYEVYERHHVRRYGFHGSSHRYVARRAAEILGRPPHEFNGITCHLGNGCSIAAVRAGRAVDTSMGLTPLEGLIMGTRSGDIDPAVLFYLAEKGYDLASLNQMCNKQSGLLGVSGVSNDYRTLRQQAQQGHARSRLAIDMFCYRIKKYVGAYSAVLGRVDAIVFTGGIGENADDVRAQVCGGLEPLGIELDVERNRNPGSSQGVISRHGSRVRLLVVPTDEEGVIAGDTFSLVSQRDLM
jgi:acetate kinase